MKRRLAFLTIIPALLVCMFSFAPLKAEAATAPTEMWVEATEENGIPARIDVFKARTGGTNNNPTYTYQLYLPGNVDLSTCRLSWNGDSKATYENTAYDSGTCPIPPLETQKKYVFKSGTQTLASFNIITYRGSANVQPVFIDIYEGNGNPTIADMDGDPDHEVTCTGRINIDGQWYDMPKIKGRGNATWDSAEDKKPYNVTLGSKINFPGVDSEKTKKWSFLAEVTDHSLLSNRSGYQLAYEIGIGQDTASADVWMNGEYQGCYTVTPKTDSFVTKDGFMVEQDNYLEDPVADGGDPQFSLTGLVSNVSGWSSAYNVITVKKMGDNLLKNAEGAVDESAENLEAVANNTIKPWLQDAWDAIRADGKKVNFGYGKGYNAKGKYYTDYIDIESFAKMYLLHEYVKSYDVCAGSILFHRNGLSDADKLIAGPAWDLDNAMGATCTNSSLGQGSDRRSGAGSFIPIITEYKTSIYKTLSQHSDFMTEVYRQYNKYRLAFDGLPNVAEQLINEIADSAKMNHYKVKDISGNQYKNTHKYDSATSLGSGQYVQNYLATTNSKTDWPNYAANLKTYITTRSLWFYNTYYDENFVCTHEEYDEVVTLPTCTAQGYTTHTCRFCGESYTDSFTPKIPHDYQNGVCTVCGETLLTATISCTEGASVTVYETQDITGAFVANATSANPRNSDTGLIDCSGDGQVNFVVNLEPEYTLVSVTAEPAGAYKNLKGPADTKIPNGYRLTKVTGDVTITVQAMICKHNYESTVTEPTCSAEGFTEHTCTICGYSYKDHFVQKLPHDYQNGACTVCGEQLLNVTIACGEGASVAVYETQNLNGASVENATSANPRDSATGLVDCSGDGQVNFVVNIEPGYTLAGVTAEPAGAYKNLKHPADTAVPNSYRLTKVTGDVTITVRTVVCTHNYEAVVTAPTCSAEGFTEYTCTICGASYKDDYVQKLPHNYEDGVCTVCGEELLNVSISCDEGASVTVYETQDITGAFAENATSANPRDSETGLIDCSGDGQVNFVVNLKPCYELENITVSPAKAYKNLKDPSETGFENWYRITKVKGDCTIIISTRAVHEYEAVVTEPTCTAGGYTTYTCTKCGSSYQDNYVSALGHDLVNHPAKAPTCTEIGWNAYQTCTRCDYTTYEEKAALGHDLVHHEAKAATCTAIGWETYDTCKRCDYTTYVEIPALGHTASAVVEENRIEPTCTVPGSYEAVIYCSTCGAELSRTTVGIAALGHDYVDHDAKAPTCTEKGWKAYKTCTRCDYTTYEEMSALGHDLVHHEAQAPTCTEIGWKAYDTCKRCNYTTYVELPARGHTASAAVEENRVEPTCTEAGSYDSVVYCSVCNAELSREKKTINALGHDLVSHNAKAPTCTEIGWEVYDTCTRCDYTTYEEIAALGHDLVHHEAKAATCMAIGWEAYDTCKRCNYTTYVEIPALGHTASAAVEENRIEPTCIEKGSYEAVVYCSTCGEELSRTTVEIVALGHDYIDHNAKAPTCTEKGWKAYKTCSRCDYTNYEEIAALGHDLVHHKAKAATCTEKGWEAYDTCTRCDYTTYVEIPALGHKAGAAVEENRVEPTCTKAGSYDSVVYCSVCNAELSREKKTIKALGHDLVHHEAKAATCTAIGWEAYDTCTRCDYTTYEEIAALGHDLVHHEAKAATCTAIGWEAYDTCSRCDYTTYAEILALGHKAGAAVVENRIEPTCTEAGSYDRVVYCSTCGAELSREKKTIKALGHDLVHHEAKAATCTAIGWEAYDTCTRCDYTTYKEIAALGHDLVHHEAKAATCTAIGWKAYDTCKRCDYTTYVEIPALGHTASAAVEENRVEPTCTEKGSYEAVIYCSTCGAELSRTTVEIAALGHKAGTAVVENRVEPTCTKAGSYDSVVYCSVCNAELSLEKKTINALGHDLIHHEAQAATCTAIGWEAYDTCSRCDYTTYTEIAAHGHTPAAFVIENNVDSTCLATGSYDKVVYCSVCSEELSRETVEVPALGHNWDSGKITKAPTCTAKGEKTFTCSRCHNTRTEEVAALGHDYVDHEAKAPTCTEKGWDAYQTCTRCAYSTYHELAALGHDLVHHEAQAATCTTIGWEAYDTCKRCDYTTYVKIPALGHTPAAAVKENNIEPACTTKGSYDSVVYCSTCGAELSRETVTVNALGHDLIHHEAKAATCTEKGWEAYDTCSRCNYTTYVEIPALGHTPAAAVKENNVDPTCTVAGSYDSVVYCSTCGAELSRTTVEIAALGHDYVDHDAKAPTCTAKGWKAYKTCTRCNYTNYEELAPLGHDLVHHEAQAATCTEKGWEAYDTCSRCDYTTYVEIPASGHKAGAAVVENRVEPTCTAAGSYDSTVYCSVCGNVLSRETITLAALGHSYKLSGWTWNGTSEATAEFTCENNTAHKESVAATITCETTPPTCETDGISIYTAAAEYKGQTYTDQKEVILFKLEHSPSCIERVEATCEEAGNIRYWKCDACGKLFLDAACEQEITAEETVIEALGHSITFVEAVDATCEEAGNIEYWKCDTCKKLFPDENCEQEITAEETVIKALGHDWGEWTVEEAATEYLSGWEIRICRNDPEHVERREIPPLGHHHQMVYFEENPATCEEEGNTEYWMCSSCEKYFSDGDGENEIEPNSWVIDPTGHHWDKGIVETPAACTEPGVMKYICKDCGEIKEESIDPLGHDLIEYEAKTPTCTAIGWHAYQSCSRCTYSTYEELGALGHTAGTIVTENSVAPSCTEAGSYDQVVYCSVCGDELRRETIPLAALGHSYRLNKWIWTGTEAASAELICEHDASHVRILTGLITCETIPATCETDGKNTFTASAEYEGQTYTDIKGIILPKLGHNLTHIQEKEATCEKAGNIEYWKCETCNKLFPDEACEQEITASDTKIKATGHHWNEGAVTKKPTYTAEGVRTFTCENCGKTRTEKIPMKELKETPAISAITNVSTGIKVSWGKIEGAAKYRIYRRIGSDSWSKLEDTATVTYTDTTAQTGQKYSYKIRCIDSDGALCSDYSKVRSITFVSPAVISKVSNVSTGIKVEWSKVTGAAGYQVYRKLGSNDWTKLGQTTSVSYTDQTAESGKKYSYRVRCIASDGSTGAFGKAVSRTCVLRPASFSVTSSAAREITVKWEKVTGVTGYQIQYSTSSSFESGVKSVKVTGAIKKVIGSLTSGKVYYVRIRSYKTVSDTEVHSVWSSAKKITVN